MQRRKASPPGGDEEQLRPLELVFTCSICNESIHDIYKFSEDNQGFSDRRQSDQKVVTRLWLTECGHLTCSTHLENGCAPLHPDGKPPAAPCPVCVSKHDDNSPKNLYSVGGLGPGEHDHDIPERFFECPPKMLDSNKGGMDALRFQFLRLLSYGHAARQKVRGSRKSHEQMFAQLEKQKLENRQLQSQVEKMVERTQTFERMEAALAKQKRRNSEVHHYLTAFPDMATELTQLRAELERLGYEVSQKDYGYKPDATRSPISLDLADVTNHEEDNTTKQNIAAERNLHAQDASGSMLRGSSSTTRGRLHTGNMNGETESNTVVGDEDRSAPQSRKRKYEQPAYEYASPQRHLQGPIPQNNMGTMPPPALPAARMSPSTVRRAEYTKATPQSRNQHVRPPTPSGNSQAAINSFQGRGWQGDRDARPFLRPPHSAGEPDTTFMSGALPNPAFHRPDTHDNSSKFRQRPPSLDTAHTCQINDAQYMQHGIYEAPEQRSFIRDSRPIQQPITHATPSQPSQHHPVYVENVRMLPHRVFKATEPQPRSGMYTRAPNSSSTPRMERRTVIAASYSPVKQQPRRPYTPSPMRMGGLARPENSIVSPFFRTGGRMQPPRVQERPSIQPTGIRGMDTQKIQQGFRMRPAHRLPSRSSPSIRAPNGPAFMPDLYYVSDREPVYEHPAMVPPYVQSYAPPQTPRDSQGYFTRPDRQDTWPLQSSRFELSSSQRPGYAEPLRSTNPSVVRPIRPIPQSSGQSEQALNSFRGVKSGNAQATPYQTGENSYSSQRPVFSRGGFARRSVIR